jgi:hypothetical protein
MASNQWHKEYRIKRRQEFIELLGGKCIKCNSTEDLEFDHIDPETKLFSIGNIWWKSYTILLEEVKKCQLLCYDCHKEKTIKERSLPEDRPIKHGTLTAYTSRKCRCTECRKAANDYSNNRRRLYGRGNRKPI